MVSKYPILGSAGKVMGYADDFLCLEGTIIIGRKGTIDKPLYIETKFWNVDTAFGLVAGENLDNRYLFYFCLNFDFKKLDKGTTLPSLVKKDLINIQIPLPSMTEQQRIVTLLDKAFKAIDKAKANAEHNLKNAKELFESYLQGVFENNGWEVKYLNEISFNLDSKRVPITKKYRVEGKIPYYGASGIVDYIDDYLFDEDLLCISEDGANLLARTYPIAFSISGKTWVNNHAHILRFNNIISQKFVELFLNSIKLNDFVSGMAQPKLNQTMLNKIKIPFPSIDIQKTTVQKAENLLNKTKKLEKIYEQKIKDLEELKKSILQKAFNGDLVSSTELNNIFQFLSKIEGISSTDLHIGIIALAYQKHQEAGKLDTFKHVKVEKISHLVESYIGLDLERHAIKDAAGPNDFNHLKKIEYRAKMAGFFNVTQKNNGYQYSPLKRFNDIADKVKQKLSPDQLDKINSLLDLMVRMKDRQPEILATVFAAWNNLLLQKAAITDEKIVYEARENWHKDKLNIDRGKFFKAINWMKENNFVPQGRGKLVANK